MIEHILACQKKLQDRGETRAAKLLGEAAEALEDDPNEALLLLAQSESMLLRKENPSAEILSDLSCLRIDLAALQADKER